MDMQNNMAPNTSPVTPPSMEGMPGNPMGGMPEKENHWGPLIGIVIVVVLLAAGGLYYFLGQQGNFLGNEGKSAEDIMNEKDGALDALKDQSTSNAYSAIEGDFNATNFNTLDSDLNAIKSDLGS